ncbi:ArnT family glycosyltransferase [Brumicola nitratireducens]|uniref:Glycosyl transferase, family 39 n=1 Tax=Glaciecola nitratireducens (strain JCM 12485 / KCTC 12276 / FR1064) TaxID=1085623 RepID=G4QM30_GLANF|nr:glycosyltransferase family 39 protein [Glaciecola nitratireducens]AEP30601.1 glycosyl transferase, family 39 [Glaciecola nitratireducens FR1064]
MNSQFLQLSPSAMRTIERLSTSFTFLFIATVLLIFIGIGLRDPWPADEPRFALVAKEMVETGQWFFPARAQEFYPDKPPIFMWSIALFYWITGSLRLSFLLPSALAGLLTIFLVFDIGKRLWDKKTGLIAGWLLLFTIQFLLQSKTAQIDATVCAFITIGCYGLLRFWLVDGKYRWYAMAWFFMGIGVITKGVGFLPLLMLIPYAFYRFKTRDKVSIATSPWWAWSAGPFIMLGAIGLWFIPMLLIVGASDNAALELYRDNILFKQTVTRYTDSWHHIKPAWYYVTSVIPLFWLPLSVMLPWLVKPWYKAFKQLDARIILPIGWVLLVVVFFSISPGKRGVYILPALPMLALSIAPFYSVLLNSKVVKNILFGLSLLLGSVLLLIAILGLLDVTAVTKLTDKIDIEPWFLFLGIGVFSVMGTFALKGFSRWVAWPVFFSVLWIGYSTYGYYLRNDVSTPLNIYAEAQLHIDEGAEIALINFSEQFILFSPYPIVHFGYHTVLKKQLMAAYQWQQQENQYLLIEDVEIDAACFDTAQAIDLGFAHRRHWMLLPASAKKEECEYDGSDLPVYRYNVKK